MFSRLRAQSTTIPQKAMGSVPRVSTHSSPTPSCPVSHRSTCIFSTYLLTRSCFAADDSNNGINPNYFYNPNVAAAILFAVLFGLPILAHIGLAIQFKTRYMVVLLFAIGMEEVGYVTRYVLDELPLPAM